MHAGRQPIGKKIVAAKWKMNLTHEEVKPLRANGPMRGKKTANFNHVSIPIKTTAEKNDVPFCSLLNRGAESL